MITYKDVEVTKLEFVSIECDKCGKVYEFCLSRDDRLEAQEFLRIRFQGGYASEFGDGTNVSCDICQYCLKEMIGKFCYYDGKREE